MRALYSSDLLSSAWGIMPLTAATAIFPRRNGQREDWQAGLTASETGQKRQRYAVGTA
ncbi:MAG: hypothetical protein ACLT46_01385 [Hungatella sp.]